MFAVKGMNESDAQILYLAMGAVLGLGLYFQYHSLRRQFQQGSKLWERKGIDFGIRVALLIVLMVYMLISTVSAIVGLFGNGHSVFATSVVLVVILYSFIRLLLLTVLKGAVFLVLEFVRSFVGPLFLSVAVCQVMWVWANGGTLAMPHLLQDLLDWLFDVGPKWIQWVYLCIMAAFSVWDSFRDSLGWE